MNTSVHVLLCEKHPGIPVTHICMSKTCLFPLCTKCIKDHTIAHTYENTFSEIEEVHKIRDSCVKKVRESIIKFTNELEKIGAQTVTPRINTGAIEILQHSKKMLLDMIDEYYRSLEANLMKNISLSEIQANNPQNYRSVNKMADYLEKLEIYNGALEKNRLLKYLKPIATTNFDAELEKLRRRYQDEKIQMKNLQPRVTVNSNVINDIEKLLRNYTEIVEGKLEVNNTELSTEVSMPQLDISSYRQPFPVKPSNANNNAGLTMNIPDYYDTDIFRRYLHFFQHKSRSLFLLDIDACERAKKYEFKKIELNIDFKIPRWHRSISTPFGEIYVTGGVEAATDAKLNNCFVYDFNNQTLIEVMNMHVCRSGHALVYLQGYLYAIGGYTQVGQFTRQCERYSIRNDKWENIAGLNVAANNPCACSFNDRMIYKFGGKADESKLNNYIEMYNPDVNKWFIVQYELYGEPIHMGGLKLLLSSSACCQINEKEIFIFGGTHADYSQKSNASFVLHIDNDYKKGEENPHSYSIREFNTYPLPVAEGFWNNQVIVADSSLYALQNIQNEKDVSIVYLDRRRILRFNPQTAWTTLN